MPAPIAPATTSAPQTDRPDLYAILMAPETWTPIPAETLARAVATGEGLWASFERREELHSYYRTRGVPAFVRGLPSPHRPE